MLYVSPESNLLFGVGVRESAHCIFRLERKCAKPSYFVCSISKVLISSSVFSKVIFVVTVFWSRKNIKPSMSESNYIKAQVISGGQRKQIFISPRYLDRTQLSLCSDCPSFFPPSIIEITTSGALQQLLVDLLCLKRFLGRLSRALLPQRMDMFRTNLNKCSQKHGSNRIYKVTCRASIRLARPFASTFCFLIAPGASRSEHSRLYSTRKLTCRDSPMDKKPSTIAFAQGNNKGTTKHTGSVVKYDQSENTCDATRIIVQPKYLHSSRVDRVSKFQGTCRCPCEKKQPLLSYRVL